MSLDHGAAQHLSQFMRRAPQVAVCAVGHVLKVSVRVEGANWEFPCQVGKLPVSRRFPPLLDRHTRQRMQVGEMATRHKLAVFKRKGFDILRSMQDQNIAPCQGVIQ